MEFFLGVFILPNLSGVLSLGFGIYLNGAVLCVDSILYVVWKVRLISLSLSTALALAGSRLMSVAILSVSTLPKYAGYEASV